MRSDVVIIGAGIAGVSLGAALAAGGKVTIVEAAADPGIHATSRSAAAFGRSYGNDVIRALSAGSLPRFLDPGAFSDVPLYRARPWLIVARADQRNALRHWQDANPELEAVGSARACSLFPLLKPDYAAEAALDTACGDLDVDALLQAYLRHFRRDGGQLYCGSPVTAITRANGLWQVTAGGEVHEAPVVANAAGAWADAIAALAGIGPLGLMPLQRTAVLVDPPAQHDISGWPLVIDAGEEFYFKPDAGKLLLSPADETLRPPGDAQADEYDVAVAVDRYETATGQSVRHVRHRWAGLRTFAPDRTPVAGFDPRAGAFYWLAGQGGYGIQTAPALSDLAAAQIAGHQVDSNLAAALSPARFGI